MWFGEMLFGDVVRAMNAKSREGIGLAAIFIAVLVQTAEKATGVATSLRHKPGV